MPVMNDRNCLRLFICIAAGYFLLVLSGCGNKTIDEFLMDNGFYKTWVINISDGHETHNSNDIEGFRLAVKGSEKIEAVHCKPQYTLMLIIGASFDSQIVHIDVCETSEGVVRYKGDEVLYFRSKQLHQFAKRDFGNTVSIPKSLDEWMKFNLLEKH
jgi:hypothetical protein